MADGVVTAVSSNGGWGSYVAIEHDINGQRVNSLYAHLIPGSAPVVPGQFVEVGQTIGGVELRARHDAVHPSPLQGLRRRDALAEQDDLAGAELPGRLQ